VLIHRSWAQQQRGQAGIFVFRPPRSYGSAPVPASSTKPPSPTRLRITISNTDLAISGAIETQLAIEASGNRLTFIGDDGFVMSTPAIFTVGETGPLTLTCTGVDGTPEDLSTASAVTLRVLNVNGTVAVNAVALTSPTSLGTAIWTRLSAQVAAAGDYLTQVKVVRADATVGYFPDAKGGEPLTILAAV
jgi:hypothetical protein